MIELKNVGKIYGHSKNVNEVVALKNVNLTINDGEIFGIIGLSGAGKSTLVRCINLLEKPTSGQVIVDNKDLIKLNKKELLEVRRNIGMIFQSFNLLEQRTVLDNVTFPLEIAKWNREDAVNRAKELLELVGLSDRIKSYPSQLSGGQKQRVAIARALATSPKYLLCDEATSALDPNTTSAILELLKKINKELNVTIIIITHEMKVIERICDRVAVIDNSVIVEEGKVSEVFTNPKSAIARSLIIPNSSVSDSKESSKTLRLVFNGEETDKPIVSGLILDCQVPVNIVLADSKVLEGKNYGQMVIQFPNNELMYEKVTYFLNINKITYFEEE